MKLMNHQITLNEWIRDWLDIYKKNNVQSSTLRQYQIILNAVATHEIGNMLMNDIQPIHIMQFYNDYNKYSESFLHKLRFLLKDVFEDAVDNEICNKNPAKKCRVKSQKTKSEKIPFTPDEVEAITDFAKNDRFGKYIILLLYTGIRSGELRALQKNQIDFDSNTLKIDKAVKSNNAIGLPKNNEIRIISINDCLSKYLYNEFRFSGKYLLSADDGNSFVSADYLKREYRAFFNRLNKMRNENHLPIIERKSPHICRHTFCTQLQRNGIPTATVSAILGHKTINITQDYTHVNTLDDMALAMNTLSFDF